jgi:para-aminobenzoate synthetase component 1
MHQHFKGEEFENWIKKANNYGKNRIPFVFIVDFDFKKPFIKKTSEIDPMELLYDFNKFTNSSYTYNI